MDPCRRSLGCSSSALLLDDGSDAAMLEALLQAEKVSACAVAGLTQIDERCRLEATMSSRRDPSTAPCRGDSSHLFLWLAVHSVLHRLHPPTQDLESFDANGSSPQLVATQAMSVSAGGMTGCDC